MRNYALSVGLLLWVAQPIYTQTDSLAYVYQDAIENTVAANADLPFDFDTEFEYLQDFIKNPLNINKAQHTEFENLKLLTIEQIKNIVAHREKQGGYLSLHELQTILDLETIRRILPFITCDDPSDEFQIPVNQWFKRGKNTLFTRYERRLEKAKGYAPTLSNGYQGDPNKVYLRYRYNFGTRLSYGVTLEKDAGERFFKPIFDFQSLHFKISDLTKVLKTLCLGDYSVSLGQGLIHENGFNLGKSALSLSIEKKNPPLRPFTASNEANFMRGAAVQVKMGWNTEGVLFASYRRRDGNIIRALKPDSTDAASVISALQFSGLHRTSAENADKNAVGLITIGGRLLKTYKRGIIAINTVFNQLSKRLEPQSEPYNVHAFRQKRLLNVSIDYKYTWQNFHFFGETAISDNGQPATLNGLLLGLDKKLSFSILQRYFATKYHSLNAQPFAETSRPQDEKGVYMGFEFKPNRRWAFNAYADFWRHDWWRFRVDAPSQGQEFFLKTAFRYKNTEGYLQLRTKTKGENIERPTNDKTNTIIDKTRTQARLHFQYRLSKNLEFRNRVELSFYKSGKTPDKGSMLYQDIIFQPTKYPLSISSRLAFFDTDSYSSAIYAYENDLLNNFGVEPYYAQGSRFYINLSYKGVKKWLFELRFARTWLANQKTIGSGLEEIKGNKRTDIKCQVRYSF